MIDYEDDETQLVVGGDRVWGRHKRSPTAKWEAYYQRNRDKIIARNTDYIHRNPDKVKVWRLRYNEHHREQLNESQRRRRHKRNAMINNG